MFWRNQEPLAAFRVANAALKKAEVEPAQAKRLRTVLVLSARALLDLPDPQTREEAFEVFEAMTPGSDERARAAQRLLRVMARTTTDTAEMDTALAALEPEMGGETEVRANLHTLSTTSTGSLASVWAATVLTVRDPEDPSRWLDLSDAHAATGQWDAVAPALDHAEARLDAFCAALPQVMAAYDRVRRLSAYAQHQVRQCRGFPAILLRRWAAAQHATALPRVATRQVESTALAAARCPAQGAVPDLGDLTAAVGVYAVSPAPQAVWLDGQLAASMGALPLGEHAVVVKHQGRCLAVSVTLREPTAVVIRTQHPPPDPTALPN